MTEQLFTLTDVQSSFRHSADVRFQQFQFAMDYVTFIHCEGLIDEQLLYELVLKEVQAICQKEEMTVQHVPYLPLPQLIQVENAQQCSEFIFAGCCVMYFAKNSLWLAVNIVKKPNRQPEETRLEVLIKGPRDNFIEDLSTNIALVRKRLPTNSLVIEKMIVGKRSKTAVALMYFEDILNEQLLNEVKEQIEKIDTDVLFSGELLMEGVNKRFIAFPRHEYTGRPDSVVQGLVRGRLAILIDGTAYAIMTPTNFFMLLKTGEDQESPFFYSSFERLLRLLGMMLSLLLPAFWLALTTFHQNQIPLQLLATVVQSNIGLPFPSVLEMLIMILFFELFREAGLRLPTILGGTISVVGGLIIGDAAIRAGVTSPAMIVVIAISTIAGFTLVNQSLLGSISIIRIFFIVLTSFFGLFGFFISLYFTLIYLSNMKTFGVPYLNIAAELNSKTLRKTLLRLRSNQYEKRPAMFKTKDSTRRGKNR